MLFRIVFIGNTNMLPEIKKSALKYNPTARTNWIGAVCPDDAIEATVECVAQGKELMRLIYKDTKAFPKYYAYTSRDSFFVTKTDATGRCISVYSPDGEIHADRFDYNKPCDTEHFESFLEPMVSIPKDTYDMLIATCHRATEFGLDVVSTEINKKDLLKEAIADMKTQVNNPDTEVAHANADDILVRTLTKLGFEDLTKVYKKVKKWYA